MGLFGPRRELRQFGAEPPIPVPGSSGFAPSTRTFNLARAEASMQKVAIWSSVNLIANIAATLPLNVYRGVGTDRTAIPLSQAKFLQDLGGKGYGTSDFLAQCVYSLALRGNVFGLIVDRSATGLPNTIALLHPDSVRITIDPTTGAVTWYINGQVNDGSNLWHKRLYTMPGQVMGMSPVGMQIATISEGLHAQNFANQWFQDGVHPSGLFVNSQAKEIKQDEAATVKQRILTSIRGTRDPLVLSGGWTYTPISIPIGESQFLETQAASSAECCRMFGPGLAELFGYPTGDTMTYANIEQRSVDLLKYTVDPWLVRLETWLSQMLPNPQYVKFDRDALLRTDALTRAQREMIMLNTGAMTINEVRTQHEDMGPVSWGQTPFSLPKITDTDKGDVPVDPDVTIPPSKPAPVGGQQV